jgi:hypothetical protein
LHASTEMAAVCARKPSFLGTSNVEQNISFKKNLQSCIVCEGCNTHPWGELKDPIRTARTGMEKE